MTKKEIEKKLLILENMLREFGEKANRALSLDSQRKRDYIVRTKYIGKLTHKQLKEDFKQEIAEKLKDTFDSVSNKVLNYEFFDISNCVFILEGFYEILKKYELKQIVIDTYGTKECK